MSGNFSFQSDGFRMLGPDVIFLAKFIKLPAPILSEKFEFTSWKFWSILNV